MSELAPESPTHDTKVENNLIADPVKAEVMAYAAKGYEDAALQYRAEAAAGGRPLMTEEEAKVYAEKNMQDAGDHYDLIKQDMQPIFDTAQDNRQPSEETLVKDKEIAHEMAITTDALETQAVIDSKKAVEAAQKIVDREVQAVTPGIIPNVRKQWDARVAAGNAQNAEGFREKADMLANEIAEKHAEQQNAA